MANKTRDTYIAGGGSAVASFETSQTLAPVLAATADSDQPAANTQCSIAYAADDRRGHVISGLAWSYNDTPTGGNLRIQSVDGLIYFSIDITAAGPGIIIFPEPKKFPANAAVRIFLDAGGASVTGKLNVLNHWLE